MRAQASRPSCMHRPYEESSVVYDVDYVYDSYTVSRHFEKNVIVTGQPVAITC